MTISVDTTYGSWPATTPPFVSKYGVVSNLSTGKSSGQVTDPAGPPASLFINNEVGVWYDPSDFSTMFQDSAGTTPVTAVEQPVGLILDKSKGLVLGAEVSTDVGFDIAGKWVQSAGTGTWAVSGSKATGVSANGKYLFLTDATSVVTGDVYSIVITVDSVASGSVQVYVGSTGNARTTAITTAGTYTLQVRSDSAGNQLGLISTNFSGEVSSLSVKKVTGNHASQSTAAARGNLKATGTVEWIDYDGVDDVLNTTFPSSLGSACTVAIANVGAAPTILTGQTIGTSYAASTDNAGLIIVNRALTAGETASLTAYLTAKGAT